MTSLRLFHVSPAHYRQAIERDGLDPDKCREPRGHLWFYRSELRARLHAGHGHPGASDVWILTDDAFIRDHTNWYTAWDADACAVDALVPPELLTRL